MEKGKKEPIQTSSYIPITPDRKVIVRLEDMTLKQRKYTATALSLRFLNARFAGKAEFLWDFTPVSDVFLQLQEREDD